ncbi:hypothetical protein [Lactobacillus sp. ESL0703]|uniref:hypothetical protein n=1 Tax=Lactobacillus sp. ESL0703 TaxID=2983218 RepID=UPI0023F8926F|nr:hypothetical protein [Lactobacillus sp. ESL0703]MDF7669553.1 hypothetical protein [Lactobacillus sp. ESL0703]
MKHFSLGAAAGAVIGIVLSLLTDKEGSRFGAPIKREVDETKEDTSNFLTAIANLKDAKQELADAIPLAEKSIIALQKDIEYYQMKLDRLIKDLKEQNNNLTSDLAAKTKK